MGKRGISWPIFGLLLAGAAALGSFEVFRFLWVFPLDAQGLPLWMLLCGVDIGLYLFGFFQARPLLWCGGLLFFTAREQVPFVGFALVLGSAMLWVVGRGGQKILPILLVVGLPLFIFGHDPALLHPGMVSRLSDLRFNVHLLASFVAFRMIAWIVAVRARGARPSFLLTMEYFLAPAFWLSPLHAAHLLFDHMEAPPEPIAKEESFVWLIQGLAYALVFSWIVTLLLPHLQDQFVAGISHFPWWEWFVLGPLLFLVTYLEKARVTYLVAGILSLSGRDVRPDFRAPWFAANLLDYWRRFHFWMWEYYVELVYLPLALVISRKLSPRTTGYVALFLSFSVGTSLIHWIHYPAPFSTALALGILFGVFSLFHALFLPALENPRVGIPCTWITVFLLYILAYPAFGLGWGIHDWLEFFRR